MRIFENANFPFYANRRIGLIVSSVLMLVAVVSLIYPGLEAGIDFRGGTEFVVETAEPVSPTQARSALAPVLGAGTEAKTFGGPNALLVRTTEGGEIEDVQRALVETLEASFPGSAPTVQRVDSVGPRFAEDLQRGALFAVLGGLLVIFLYVFIRFDWRFSVGAVLCLAHDVLIVLGLFALLHEVSPVSMQIDQTIIAALLTIVGYSINDTVVVYDRIREFTALFKTKPFAEIVDRGINSTLSRTVITSGTTLLTVFVLFLFGGEVLRGFALALLVGIGIGTYSSIFVAAPIVVMMRERFPVKRQTKFVAARA